MLFTILPWRSMTRVTVELDLVHHEIILDVILHVNIPETLSYMRPIWLMPGMVEMAWLSRMWLMRISLFRICHIVSFHPTHSLVGEGGGRLLFSCQGSLKDGARGGR